MHNEACIDILMWINELIDILYRPRLFYRPSVQIKMYAMASNSDLKQIVMELHHILLVTRLYCREKRFWHFCELEVFSHIFWS